MNSVERYFEFLWRIHVLYLHLMGTDYKTIAELLGKSPKSIDNALQRIKAKAEKMLDKSE